MKCNLCANNCNTIRNNTFGRCGVNDKIKIARSSLHYDEEPVISGKSGSGAIFFCGCPLKCVFCQNFDLSRNKTGKEITPKQLAEEYKKLEDLNAHNINLVNPTHFADKIIESLDIYRPAIPVVYNTHAYENFETIKLLENYVDIYLPDLKFIKKETAKRYCNHPDYFETASLNIKEMVRQKPLLLKKGLLKTGVIIRHLVLPMNIPDTINILEWLNDNIAKNALTSLMAQYTPFGDLDKFPELRRKLTHNEYLRAKTKMESLNLDGFVQELSSSNTVYIPKWDY